MWRNTKVEDDRPRNAIPMETSFEYVEEGWCFSEVGAPHDGVPDGKRGESQQEHGNPPEDDCDYSQAQNGTVRLSRQSIGSENGGGGLKKQSLG